VKVNFKSNHPRDVTRRDACITRAIDLSIRFSILNSHPSFHLTRKPQPMSQQDRPPPLPSIDSMINDLSLRGVSIHASQLEKPTPEFLEDLYMAITARITGVTMEMVHTLANEFVEQYDENSAFYFLDRVRPHIQS